MIQTGHDSGNDSEFIRVFAGATVEHAPDIVFAIPRQAARIVPGRADLLFQPQAAYRSGNLRIDFSMTRLPCELGAGELGQMQIELENGSCGKRFDHAEVAWRESTLTFFDRPMMRAGRIKIVRSRQHAYCLKASAPVTCDDDVAIVGSKTVATLSQYGSANNELAEVLDDHACKGGDSIRFRLPSSWRACSSSTDASDGFREFVSRANEGSPSGACRMRCDWSETGSTQGMTQLIKRSSHDLIQRGYSVSGVPLCPADSPFANSRSYLYCPGVTDSNDSSRSILALGALLVVREEGSLMLSVESPTRENSLLDWAIARRAFEIARDSLRWNAV